MNVVALEEMVKEAIAAGEKPFYINSVAGSTVMGSFDDMHAIADICDKYNIWFNIDGCWGGFLSFADGQREKGGLFDGSERANSVTINAHKGFSVPNQAALLMVNNEKDILRAAFDSGAEYLFHGADYNKYDIADQTLSCGRRPDSFKIWMSLQRYGH
jgi:glutamate/tyrosine decarboxylase-like PLP-dependent enzyme